MLDGAERNGGRSNETSCLLKWVIRDPGYMFIAVRLDIAAAGGAS